MCFQARAMSAWSRCGQPSDWHTPFFHSTLRGMVGQANMLSRSGFTACQIMGLLEALLDAAGQDLNYGSFAAAADGLEVDLPIQPDPMTYGPPPSADGDPTAYLHDWDPDAVDFVLRES